MPISVVEPDVPIGLFIGIPRQRGATRHALVRPRPKTPLPIPPPALQFPLMHAAQIPNFDQLTDEQRLALADEILGSLRSPELLPPPLAHRAELDRRWAAFEANPESALTKDQFRARVASLRQ